MRTAFTIISTLLFFSLKAQATKTKPAFPDSKREFKNQSEREDYWAGQFFNKNYSKQSFDKYNGDIQVDGDSFKYSDRS